MKDMTFEQLVAAPVTDELIREAGKRVWEAQGNCAHRETTEDIGSYGMAMVRCAGCNSFTHKHHPLALDIPDITKPEVWGPILLILLTKPHCACISKADGPKGDGKYWVDLTGDPDDLEELENTLDAIIDGNCSDLIMHEDLGLAIGFAFLRAMAASEAGRPTEGGVSDP